MSQPSVSPTPFANLRSRSMGMKLIVVCGLALLMTIPGFFVSSLVEERTRRAADVINEISSHVGGEQTFLGPALAIPYTIPAHSSVNDAHHGVYFVFPAQASAVVKTVTEERRRSLFKVPVFQAELKFDAAFDLTGVPASAPDGAELDWPRAEIVVGVSDARGAISDASLTAEGATKTFVPAAIAPELFVGNDHNHQLRLALFGTQASGAKPGMRFHVTSALRFSGARRLAILAYGKTTQLTVQGDWPNPSFDGGFLPTTRTVSNSGFNASWSVPFMARGVPAEGSVEDILGLDAATLGVSFVEVADPYQSVDRSLKYVLLFLGLLFLSYFVFEVTTAKRVHPAQYVLVGMAQIIFYLLLLSFTERIGFDLGFLLAGGSTVALLALNAAWVFASRPQGLRALGVFSLLYLLIYLLLRLEDNALLVGALASFLAVSAVMYFTRGIDWYSSLPGPEAADQPAVPQA
jgi:inner membrane protein